MTTNGLITTSPVVNLCERCGQIVLTGHAEGLRAKVDPTPLDRVQQVLAAVGGLQLYRLHRLGLVHIDQSRAQSAHRWVIVPQHTHFVKWEARSSQPVTTPEVVSTDHPPF